MQRGAERPAFQSRVVPVVVMTRTDQAVGLAEALLAGGIDVIEITLRSDAALAAIERVAREVPQMVVAAGSVVTAAQVQQVQDAGARLAFSPGFTPALGQAARNAQLFFVPGVATPSEAMVAQQAGFTLLKCFPAAQVGGPAVLKAWAGPLPDLRFCPTGGVSLANMAEYLALPNVAMVGGSWLTPQDAVARGDWAAIKRLALEATRAAASA